MPRAVDVEPVAVIRVRLANGMDAGVRHGHVFAAVDEAAPVRRVRQLDVANGDIPGFHEPDHLRGTPGNGELVPGMRVVRHLQEGADIAVDLPRTAQGDVFLFDAEQEMSAARVVSDAELAAVLGAHVDRVVVRRIGTALEYRAVGQMEIDAAFEEHRSAEIRAARQKHFAAAGRVRRIHRPLHGDGVLGDAVALRAAVAHVENCWRAFRAVFAAAGKSQKRQARHCCGQK